jgi:hypothetical protein
MAGHYGWMADTDPDAFRALIEIRRNMTFDERFRQSSRCRKWSCPAMRIVCAANAPRPASVRFSCEPRRCGWETRRCAVYTLFTGEPLELAVATPEDVILSKLRRFHMGGKVSEQQWHDVLGVIAVQGDELDLGYLGEWAEYLGVRNLLEKALAESREPHQPLALLPLLAPGHLDRF